MTDTQFDEKIREMLSEPQEQIPEGLWEGIEARLDAAVQRRRAVVMRRWIAGVSAAAAAVVIGLVAAHFVPSGRVAGSEVLAGNTVTGIPDGRSAEETEPAAAGVDEEAAAGDGKAAGTEVRFDVVKKGDSGLLAMAAVPEAAKETEVRETATKEETAAKGAVKEEADATEAAKEETAANDAEAGETAKKPAASEEAECKELKVDNSDIEEAYGGESRHDGGYKGTPFEISVGGNSCAGPQKSSGVRKMFSKGSKTPSGKEFVEGSNSDTYSLPLSFGVGVRYGITKWLGIGVGINYTLLNKKVTGIYYDEHGWSCSTDMKNSQHYIGIPLDIYFSLFRKGRWDAYATVGGAVEKCILNRYNGTFEDKSLLYTRKVKGVQTSVKVGLGVEFSPIEFLGIYIDPSLRYYFDNNQPRSIRTEQPLAFGFEAGLRFKL